MYDPTFTHKITMTLYEDRLQQAAAAAQSQGGAPTGALRELLGRAAPRIVHESTTALAPEPVTASGAR